MVEAFTVINTYHYSEFNKCGAKMKFPKLFPIEFEESLRAWLTHQGDLRHMNSDRRGRTNG